MSCASGPLQTVVFNCPCSLRRTGNTNANQTVRKMKCVKRRGTVGESALVRRACTTGRPHVSCGLEVLCRGRSDCSAGTDSLLNPHPSSVRGMADPVGSRACCGTTRAPIHDIGTYASNLVEPPGVVRFGERTRKRAPRSTEQHRVAHRCAETVTGGRQLRDYPGASPAARETGSHILEGSYKSGRMCPERIALTRRPSTACAAATASSSGPASIYVHWISRGRGEHHFSLTISRELP